jgi:hypothetical protein
MSIAIIYCHYFTLSNTFLQCKYPQKRGVADSLQNARFCKRRPQIDVFLHPHVYMKVSVLKGLMQPFRWLWIILAPALAPIVPVIAMLGLMISMFFIYLGFFAEPPRDHNRLRYLFSTLQLEEIAKAIERYRADCGAYLTVSDGLTALVLDPGAKGWNGPYLKDVPA